ncbi:MAG: YitT family protein [Bacteroidales bacterium]|nr:YitT family protein [Bacteroidales bacterium]
MKKQINWKREVVAYMFLVIGSALFAIGDVMFVNPYLLAPGGTYGLSNVLNTVWPWRISYYALCMDIPLLVIGTWILGPKFGFKTILSTFMIFGFTWVIETVWGYNPVVHDGIFANVDDMSGTLRNIMVQIPHSENYFMPDYFLNTLVAGGIYGVAIGLIFKSGATSGGSDIISMILHKYTKISLGTLVMIVDSCITLTTLVAFGQLRLPIYSILVIVIEGKIIDLVVEGMKTYKTAFVITDKVDVVRDFIVNDMKRGGTCFVGTGLYKGQERKMIYINLDRSDLVKLKNNLADLDPDAFVNVMESSEVMGRGFIPIPTSEK